MCLTLVDLGGLASPINRLLHLLVNVSQVRGSPSLRESRERKLSLRELFVLENFCINSSVILFG